MPNSSLLSYLLRSSADSLLSQQERSLEPLGALGGFYMHTTAPSTICEPSGERASFNFERIRYVFSIASSSSSMRDAVYMKESPTSHRLGRLGCSGCI